ncbi:MAG: TIGR02302 family protein [Pseudomonadota bacterium]
MAETKTGKRRFSTTTSLVIAKASVERQTRRARIALWVERVLGAFWPVWALIAAFGGLVLLGVPASLPVLWHYGLLVVFGLGGVGLFIYGCTQMRRPSEAEALALLDEGTRGRPAQTYSDALAAGAGDAGTRTLWAAHQRMLAEKAALLKARMPDLRVSHRDQFALRHGALITLAAGVIAYFGADGVRLADQIKPGAIAVAEATPAPTVEAWASPPLYTGATPIYLTRTDPADGPVSVPIGTEISLRVFDVEEPPVLADGVSGIAVVFEDSGAGVFDAVLEVRQNGAVTITSGETQMAVWDIVSIPDVPPSIAFDGEPHGGERGALTLPYRASDDYGIRIADALIELNREAAADVPGLNLDSARASVYEPITLDLPLPLTGDGTEITETLIEDLTEHPWAGLPVRITLTATDAADQAGTAEMTLPMPGRRFYHPMARALIEQRRAIAFSPDAAPRVLDVLEAVMVYPEDAFDDTTAYLAARMAVRRLGYALEDGRLEEETRSIVDLLWKAAIRLEDGNLSNAAERLARAQERLREAIENGASDEELAELMQELREAMQDYMQQLAQEAQRDQANGQQQQQQQQGQQGDQQMITQDDIEKMLQELEEAIKNGQQELARQMLQALQQMMNSMQMAQPGQGQPGQGEQTMNQMGDMIGEQQGLADRSFDQMRRGQQQGEQQGGGQQRGQEGDPNGQRGNDPGDDPGQIARDQQALQQLLDELRGNLPGSAGEGTREALDEAERAMGDAVDSLEQGDTRQAVDDQVRALDALRDGRRQLGQDLADAQGQGQGDQAGRDGPGGDSEREDPLGRPSATDGPLSGDSVKVPGAALGKRARDLQDEIRRRSGERTRPAEELDYLERLLDRF